MPVGEISRERRLVDVASAIESPWGRRLYTLVGTPFEKLFSVAAVNRLYAELLAEGRERTDFFDSVLDTLGVDYEVSREDIERVPADGPVIVVANHPFGAIEGLVLGHLVTRVRPDVRVMANHLLAQFTEMRPWLIPVDPFGGPDATWANIAPLKACLKWLGGGGLLATFPSGTVSHLHLRRKEVVDPQWNTAVAGLAKRTRATVVPIHFAGRNGALFQMAGFISPKLRTALLPHELVRRSGTTIKLRIGRPIGPDRLAEFEDARTLTDYLRFKTYSLTARDAEVRPRWKAVRPASPPRLSEALGAPVPAEVLAAEVARLPPDANLLEQGPFKVLVARAAQIPAMLREIGRLREVTFRAVGEGTGKAVDLDAFDQHYLHLFMWNEEKGELVGAYRLGEADKIFEEHGLAGLYTSTLFKFKPGLLDRLNPALELGRSFVRQEYQRKHTSLALIWRGIGELLVRRPQYKILFGPVSISRDYRDVSRQMMVEFLEETRGDDELGGLVKAKNPPRGKLRNEVRSGLRGLAGDVEGFSGLIADLEDDSKGLPVLLKHYLKLGARLLGFNVDPAFGDCLDGLIVVDLRTTDPKILKRFMGNAGHEFFASV
jgi:putative hemolysin